MKTSTRNVSLLISRYLGLWWFMGSMDTGRDWRFEVRVLCRNCPLCLKAFFQGFWLGKCGCIALFENSGCVATCTNTQTPGGQKHFPPFSTISFLGAALLRAENQSQGQGIYKQLGGSVLIGQNVWGMNRGHGWLPAWFQGIFVGFPQEKQCNNRQFQSQLEQTGGRGSVLDGL